MPHLLPSVSMPHLLKASPSATEHSSEADDLVRGPIRVLSHNSLREGFAAPTRAASMLLESSVGQSGLEKSRQLWEGSVKQGSFQKLAHNHQLGDGGQLMTAQSGVIELVTTNALREAEGVPHEEQPPPAVWRRCSALFSMCCGLWPCWRRLGLIASISCAKIRFSSCLICPPRRSLSGRSVPMRSLPWSSWIGAQRLVMPGGRLCLHMSPADVAVSPAGTLLGLHLRLRAKEKQCDKRGKSEAASGRSSLPESSSVTHVAASAMSGQGEATPREVVPGAAREGHGDHFVPINKVRWPLCRFSSPVQLQVEVSRELLPPALGAAALEPPLAAAIVRACIVRQPAAPALLQASGCAARKAIVAQSIAWVLNLSLFIGCLWLLALVILSRAMLPRMLQAGASDDVEWRAAVGSAFALATLQNLVLIDGLKVVCLTAMGAGGPLERVTARQGSWVARSLLRRLYILIDWLL